MPEAYLLLYQLSTSRPGLLVLDADARRIHSIALPKDPVVIAKELGLVNLIDPVEMFRVTVSGANERAFRDAVEELDAVEETIVRKGVFRISVTEGELDPARLDELAKKHKVALRWYNPVPVALRPSVSDPKGKAAGIWYVSRDKGYVSGLLLDPKALAAVTSDLEARTFSLPGVPKGGGGARVASAPVSVPGVLTVFPDIFGNKELVVARKGAVKWADVQKAFKKTGVNAKPKR